eukprot:TRINITY_DN7364_c0_g1_i1.p1 TRINITY_DN7364_c0_g1~~TRINITY_DN7364_c0_g1_i1.p1  ORF type:complete len:57 (-),score=5.20 TRINITY_DN7364_c0_g1_i1:187-357(-)
MWKSNMMFKLRRFCVMGFEDRSDNCMDVDINAIGRTKGREEASRRSRGVGSCVPRA